MRPMPSELRSVVVSASIWSVMRDAASAGRVSEMRSVCRATVSGSAMSPYPSTAAIIAGNSERKP